MEYQKLSIKKYPKPLSKVEDESRYWRQFKSTAHVKEFAAVTSIEFSPQKPFDFCVSSSARVQIYSATSQVLKKTLSRFGDVVNHASYRNDGKLVVAGDGSGNLQIFDLNSRSILRSFHGHKMAVRACRFLPSNTHLASVSDDKTVKIWDIPSQMVTNSFDDSHSDYVRSLAVSKTNSNMVITASYDSTVKVWDLRAGKCVNTLYHDGVPVEAVVGFPGDGMMASVAGNRLFIWDILGGSDGQVLNVSSNHQKTITSLCFNRTYSRLFTGSLDQQVKIHNVSDFSVTHSIKYPAPVLSVGVSPDDCHIAAGMVTGLLSIRKKHKEPSTAPLSSDKMDWSLGPRLDAPTVTRHEMEMKERPGSFKFFLRGRHKLPAADDHVVTNKSKPKLLPFERKLKSFEHGAALDLALAQRLSTGTIITLIEELKCRGDALRNALSSRDENALEPILKFVLSHFKTPKYADTLFSLLDIILDIYGPVIHASPALEQILRKIQQKAVHELEFQSNISELLGVMDMIM
eukprot:Partr_v1_DN26439_c1_g1_i1_m24090 putative U3 small nucleolar